MADQRRLRRLPRRAAGRGAGQSQGLALQGDAARASNGVSRSAGVSRHSRQSSRDARSVLAANHSFLSPGDLSHDEQHATETAIAARLPEDDGRRGRRRPGRVGAAAGVHAAGSDDIKVGLIGCGGRGTGAADNVLHSAPNVTIVALGDAFEDRARRLPQRPDERSPRTTKVKELGNKVDVPEERCFVGLDAYKKVIDSRTSTTSSWPRRPASGRIHLEAAVAAGKNIFTEKPVGVDGPGIRKVLEAYEEAKKKGLAIVAGTQRRHQTGYLETMKRIHDGDIGDIVGGRGLLEPGHPLVQAAQART